MIELVLIDEIPTSAITPEVRVPTTGELPFTPWSLDRFSIRTENPGNPFQIILFTTREDERIEIFRYYIDPILSGINSFVTGKTLYGHMPLYVEIQGYSPERGSLYISLELVPKPQLECTVIT